MKKKIVHLITHDKFTAGYINFMKQYIDEYNHFFLVSAQSCSKNESIEGKLVNEENVIRFTSGRWLAFSEEIKDFLKEADKIIVSGIFGVEQMIYFWPKKVFEKIYLHYWGGDFYQMREAIPIRNCGRRIRRYMLKSVFKQSAGAIFLINGEYEKYREITGYTKDKVYVAAMPYDPNKNFPYDKYRKKGIELPIRIVIGNSATQENCHREALQFLEHLRDENIEIYCPLSYGDEDYRSCVAEWGLQIFGEKFFPIYDWMEEAEYYKFLATCDIGVFCNNRQQGMGNINALIRMGKKVFLKKNTSMFLNYQEIGCKCFDIESLAEMGIEELCFFPEQEMNEKNSDILYTPQSTKKQWIKVLES